MTLSNDVIEEISESVLDILEGSCMSLKSIYHCINDSGSKDIDAISYQVILEVLESLEEDGEVIFDEESDLWSCPV